MAQDSIDLAMQLAIQHHQAGRLAHAEKIYRQVLAQQPNHAPTLHLIGVIAAQTGRLDAAIDLIRRAIAVDPAMEEYHFNLSNALHERGLLDESIAALRQAIALNPDYADAHNNLGAALREKGRPDEAFAALSQAMRLKSDSAETRCNLGNVLRDKGLLDEAIEYFHEALRLKPQYPDALSNLGNTLRDQGLLDEAIAAYRQALWLKPDFIAAHSNLVFTLHYHERSDPPTLLDESRQWARQHADPLKRFIPRHANDRSPDRRLKIGYVSPDFCSHPVGRFLLPLLMAHDPAQVEIFCYAHVIRPDVATSHIREHAHQWRDTVGLNDQQMAEQIYQDRIDILIDLSAHTADSRLVVFARKPAPVQATYLAYPGTTGLDTIDYRITDPYLDPPDEPNEYSAERCVRLVKTYWCYQPQIEIATTPVPAADSQSVTFGCLNTFCKITSVTVQTWCGLLAAVPNSRLVLHACPGSHRDRIRQALPGYGVDPQRLEFVDKLPFPQYMKLYQRIDIALDPFPYGGGTTTCDALWMGVPVVTLLGRTAVGRTGFSILTNLGLPELIARSPQQYVQIAVGLSANLPRLAVLRSTLRDRMKSSPLMDAPRFARNMEAAYRQMWRNWCLTG
jgi:protein O-GlcNAc transferase